MDAIDAADDARVSMLLPHPHEGPSPAVRDRQAIENLRRLLNRAEAGRRSLETERDMARWQLILDGNKIAALQSEAARLRCEVEALAGEVEELRARLAWRA